MTGSRVFAFPRGSQHFREEVRTQSAECRTKRECSPRLRSAFCTLHSALRPPPSPQIWAEIALKPFPPHCRCARVTVFYPPPGHVNRAAARANQRRGEQWGKDARPAGSKDRAAVVVRLCRSGRSPRRRRDEGIAFSRAQSWSWRRAGMVVTHHARRIPRVRTGCVQKVSAKRIRIRSRSPSMYKRHCHFRGTVRSDSVLKRTTRCRRDLRNGLTGEAPRDL
jgi:hypothetical protein